MNMNIQKNFAGLKIGDTLNVRLIASRRGGLQAEERISGRRAFISEDRAFKWASAGEVWKVRLDSENSPKNTLYFLKLLSRVSEPNAAAADKGTTSNQLSKMAREAGTHYHAGRFSEAAVIYERGLEAHPEEAFFAVQLAACFVEMKRHSDAIHLYQQLANHYLETISELTGLPVDALEQAS